MSLAQFSVNLERIEVKIHKETIKVRGRGHSVAMVMVAMTIVFV